MRISHRARSLVALAWLLAAGAGAVGCGTTVDGVATCPGCGSATEPDFPTARPPTTTPSTTAVPPSGVETLSPNASGYVYIETRSGVTRCQISADTVGCESAFTNSPVIGGERATGVEVSAGGSNRWVVGNLGAMPTVTIGYATYRAVGWTIEADSGGTRFTNDASGHGMFVSKERVEFY